MKKVVKNLYFLIFLGLFGFASTNLQSAKQKEASLDDSLDATQLPCEEEEEEEDATQVRQEFLELLQILELRADAIFYAINESIIRSFAEIDLLSLAKKDKAKKQTRTAINIASNAYTMASEIVKQKLDFIEKRFQEMGAFCYSKIEKIIENDVLKSEQISLGDFKKKSLAFQFNAISEILTIKDWCLDKYFLEYVKSIQELHTRAAELLHLKPCTLFLEELNIPKDNIVKLCKYLFAAHVRNIIDLAFKTELTLPASSGKYSSPKIEARKKKVFAEIVGERENVCSRLLTLAEIKDLILQQINGLPQKLITRILALADPENANHLIHYVQVWDEQTKTATKSSNAKLFSLLNSEIESFKKIFSGIDLKKEDLPQNAQNIWPNLVAKLTECKFEFLVRAGGSAKQSEPRCSSSTKTASSSKKAKAPTQEELKADQAAQELIAQDEAAKKKSKAEKQKAAAKTSAKKSKAVAKSKEKKHVEKPKATPTKQKAKSKKQIEGEPAPSTLESSAAPQTPEFLLSPILTSQEQAATPKAKPAEEAACSQKAALVPCTSIEQISTHQNPIEQIQDTEIEEDCVPNALELQQTQWGEPANPIDQVCIKYNCIWDLSRLDLSSGKNGYQCKIFLHPEAAVSGVNFLVNLDYSQLPKYKNPKDNNHAFSNLVEKHFGSLGVISSQRRTGNGWIVIRITFPGRITWIGHEMSDACQLPPNGTFEFVIMKRDMNPNSYARCVHRFFRPN